MDVHLSDEQEARLAEIAARSGARPGISRCVGLSRGVHECLIQVQAGGLVYRDGEGECPYRVEVPNVAHPPVSRRSPGLVR
jgi:hypothetical protein